LHTHPNLAQKIPESGLWQYARIDQKANEKSKSVLKKTESLDNPAMKKISWDCEQSMQTSVKSPNK